jgi:hypothetical protein
MTKTEFHLLATELAHHINSRTINTTAGIVEILCRHGYLNAMNWTEVLGTRAPITTRATDPETSREAARRAHANRFKTTALKQQIIHFLAVALTHKQLTNLIYQEYSADNKRWPSEQRIRTATKELVFTGVVVPFGIQERKVAGRTIKEILWKAR